MQYSVRMAGQRATKGRPRIGDPDAISAAGLRLIADNGWSATTMAQIAGACELSTPTLFRYFPTKASVLWHGMDHNVSLFREAFDARAADATLVDAVFDAYLRMLHESGQLALIKTRMAIVARDADAAYASFDSYERWRALVIAFAAEYRGEGPDDVQARITGATLWAGLWAVIGSWALSASNDPDDFVNAAREVLSRQESGR
ncbi:hypothetical protein BH11ACT2_BH11ACT2_05430 [soil metagenome]